MKLLLFWWFGCFFKTFWFCFCPKGVQSVKIVEHLISQTVDGSNASSSIVVDCDYKYDPSDIKLVVRWFYNGSPEPIYQWIPESDTRYVGQSIRRYFDMNYRIGEDRFTKYRAIRLVPEHQLYHHYQHTSSSRSHLPVSLSGNYTCVVSSIMNQDSQQGQLVIFGRFTVDSHNWRLINQKHILFSQPNSSTKKI